MALTLVTRETFQGVGTLDSGTPGNLGTVTGGFYKRAVGPRLTTDMTANSLGWSADMRISSQTNHDAYHVISIVGTAAEWKGTLSVWFYFDNFANNGANVVDLSSLRQGNGNQLLGLQLDSSTGNFRYISQGVSTADSGISVPLRTWLELRYSWENIQASVNGNYNVEAAYRVSGGSSWTSIYSRSNFSTGSTPGTEVRGGSVNNNGSSGTFNGRYGMPSLYALGAYSDRAALILDVTDPTSGGHTWYVNPSTGSDNNDGTDSGHAWLTVDKINTESTYCGLFPATSYATGDALIVDTTAANLVLGTSYLKFQTQGLNVIQLGGGLAGTGEIQAWKSLTNSSFTLTSATTKVYQITDAEPSIVPWENDKWLTHITGSNLAAVQATLESTAGSFWTDGTTLYVHPFGDTNPATDGKTYTRSIHRNSPTGESAVELYAGDMHVNGLRVRKTCLADKSTDDPILAYCVHGLGLSGTSLIENCYADYGSKHIFGFTETATGEQLTISNCQAEQGTPYGSQSPFVSYNGGGSTLGNVHMYSHCTNLKVSGLAGSTAGISLISGASGDSFLSHNNGGTNQFSLISFDHCNFGGTLSMTAPSAAALTITDSTYGGGPLSCSTGATINRCLISGEMPYNGATGYTITVRNSIVVPTFKWGGGLNFTHDLNGTETFEVNVFDLTAVASGSSGGGLFKHATNSTLTLRDNIVILPNSAVYGIYENLTTGDTIIASNNIIQIPGGVIAIAYNDGSTTADRTLAQWKTLGNDAQSLSSSNLLLDSSYFPQKTSPAVRAGVNVGPVSDYNGTLTFTVRDTVGAYQTTYAIIPATSSFLASISIAPSAAYQSSIKYY